MATSVNQNGAESVETTGKSKTRMRLFTPHDCKDRFTTEIRDVFFKHPEQMVCYVPEIGISHLWVIVPPSQVGMRTSASRFTEAMDTTLVVSLKGECKGQSKMISYGISFGSDSVYNASGLLPGDVAQTTQMADLHALKIVLETVIRQKGTTNYHFKKISRVLVMTDSPYLCNSMVKDIWKWEENGFMTSQKKNVANAEALKDVHETIKGLEAKKVGIYFWQIEEKSNTEATFLATSALASAGLIMEDENKKKTRIRKKKGKKGASHVNGVTGIRSDTAAGDRAVENARQNTKRANQLLEDFYMFFGPRR